MTAYYVGNPMATLETRQEIIIVRNCTRDADGFLIDTDSCHVPFWYTRTGVTVKWALFFGFTTIFFLYILAGYYHAKRRISKGLVPLAYHRWLVPRATLARVDPRYAYTASYGYYPYRPEQYAMAMPPPPPVYDPNRLPVYEGSGVPEGSTKTAPSQWGDATRRPADNQTGNYAAPPGPPSQQR